LEEVRRLKLHSTNEDAPTSKKAACSAEDTPPKEVAFRNFFAPLRTTLMDADAADAEATTHEAVTWKACSPPPIILTAKKNLIQLQKQLKNVVNPNLSSVTQETKTESSQLAWRISKPLNPTFQITTSPTSPSFKNPKSP
jgi:hypothetical protein